MPGGVNSPVRAFGSVGATPRFFVSASGPRVTDVEGREYVDLVGSWGPAILGHAHPAVVKAVQDAAARGLGFGAIDPGRDRAGRARRGARDARRRARPIEKLRLVSTGTEATMTAIRLARGATGRDLIVKFAGHYHGHSDGLLAEAGSGVATLAMPGSAGVPAPIAAQTLVIPYNDLDAVRAVFARPRRRHRGDHRRGGARQHGHRAAGHGFNAAIAAHRARARRAAHPRRGAHRLPRRPRRLVGHRPACRLSPDLITFGKVVGGGLPLAALGGRADAHGPARPARPGLPGGHAERQSARRRGGTRDARGSPTRTPTRASMPRHPSSRRRSVTR